MTEFLAQFIVPITITASIIGSVGVLALIIILRDKISGIHFSRAGFEIRTNDVPTWKQIIYKIDRIDANTRKTIRKATTALAIIDPAAFEMSPEAILIVREANFPLVCATYENHHTRELLSDGGDVYLADKANDIWEAVRIWSKHHPELTFDRAEALVCHWFKKILSPTLRRACAEKVEYYMSQIQNRDVSKPIKADLDVCRKKNLEYIQRIDELSKRPDIAEKSSILYKDSSVRPVPKST